MIAKFNGVDWFNLLQGGNDFEGKTIVNTATNYKILALGYINSRYVALLTDNRLVFSEKNNPLGNWTQRSIVSTLGNNVRGYIASNSTHTMLLNSNGSICYTTSSGDSPFDAWYSFSSILRHEYTVLYYDGSRFIIISPLQCVFGGNLAGISRPDWKYINLNLDIQPISISYGGGWYILGGTDGVAFASNDLSDENSWIRLSAVEEIAEGSDLRAATYKNGYWMFVGDKCIITSGGNPTEGWIEVPNLQPSATTGSFYSVAEGIDEMYIGMIAPTAMGANIPPLFNAQWNSRFANLGDGNGNPIIAGTYGNGYILLGANQQIAVKRAPVIFTYFKIVSSRGFYVSPNERFFLGCELTPNDPSPTLIWSSDNINVEVDQSGQIFGRLPGSATITCTHLESGLTDSVAVTCREGLAGISLESINGTSLYENERDSSDIYVHWQPTSIALSDLSFIWNITGGTGTGYLQDADENRVEFVPETVGTVIVSCRVTQASTGASITSTITFNVIPFYDINRLNEFTGGLKFAIASNNYIYAFRAMQYWRLPVNSTANVVDFANWIRGTLTYSQSDHIIAGSDNISGIMTGDKVGTSTGNYAYLSQSSRYYTLDLSNTPRVVSADYFNGISTPEPDSGFWNAASSIDRENRPALMGANYTQSSTYYYFIDRVGRDIYYRNTGISSGSNLSWIKGCARSYSTNNACVLTYDNRILRSSNNGNTTWSLLPNLPSDTYSQILICDNGVNGTETFVVAVGTSVCRCYSLTAASPSWITLSSLPALRWIQEYNPRLASAQSTSSTAYGLQIRVAQAQNGDIYYSTSANISTATWRKGNTRPSNMYDGAYGFSIANIPYMLFMSNSENSALCRLI